MKDRTALGSGGLVLTRRRTPSRCQARECERAKGSGCPGSSARYSQPGARKVRRPGGGAHDGHPAGRHPRQNRRDRAVSANETRALQSPCGQEPGSGELISPVPVLVKFYPYQQTRQLRQSVSGKVQSGQLYPTFMSDCSGRF